MLCCGRRISFLNRKIALVLATLFVGGGAANSLLGGFNSATPASAAGSTLRQRFREAPAQSALVVTATVVAVVAASSVAIALNTSQAPVVVSSTHFIAGAPEAAEENDEPAMSEEVKEPAEQEVDQSEPDPDEDLITLEGAVSKPGSNGPINADDSRNDNGQSSSGDSSGALGIGTSRDADGSSVVDSTSDSKSDAGANAAGDADARSDTQGDDSADSAADGGNDAGGEQIDDSDPTLLVGFECYAENPVSPDVRHSPWTVITPDASC